MQSLFFYQHFIECFITFFTGVIIGLLLSLFAKRKKQRISHKMYNDKYNSTGTDTNDMERSLRSLEQQNEELKRSIDQERARHQETKRQLEEALKFAQTPVSDDTSAGVESLPERPGTQTAEETTRLYFIQPTTDGHFREAEQVAKAEEAIYEICYYKGNTNEATLRFIDTQINASFAVQNEAAWILTACDRNNIPTEHTVSVRTDMPGVARLQNGVWEIVRKAKITYL